MATYSGPVSFVANGADVNFTVTFPFLSTAFLVVKLDAALLTIGVDYTVSGSTVTLLSTPTSGQTVELSRTSGTSDDLYLSSYTNNMDLSSTVLERVGVQPWHALQELQVTVDALAGIDTDLSGAIFYNATLGGYDALSSKIRAVVDPTADQDAATKAYVDSIAQFGIGGVPTVVRGTTDGISNQIPVDAVPDLIANNVMVFIGGSIQQPVVDFTVNTGGPGSTIVLATVPAASLAYTVYVVKSVQVIPSTSISDDSIVTAMLSAGSVTEPKIGALAVTGAKIAVGAVGTAQLADGAITNAKIPDGEITAAKLAAGATIGSIGHAELKTANFAVAPGGSVDQFIAIEHSTGAQQRRVLTASDISNLQSTLAAETLDQFSAPAGPVLMGNQNIQNLLDPVLAQDAATKEYVDNAVTTDMVRGPFLIYEQTLVGNVNEWDIVGWKDASYDRYDVRFAVSLTPTGQLNMRMRDQATQTWITGNNTYNGPYINTGGVSNAYNMVTAGQNFNTLNMPVTAFELEDRHGSGAVFDFRGPSRIGSVQTTGSTGSGCDGFKLYSNTSGSQIKSGSRVQIFAWRPL